jgi:hypothetical protein
VVYANGGKCERVYECTNARNRKEQGGRCYEGREEEREIEREREKRRKGEGWRVRRRGVG